MLLVEHDKSIITIIKTKREEEREREREREKKKEEQDNEELHTVHDCLILYLSRFQNHDNRLFFMTSNDKTRNASPADSSSTTPKYSTTERNCKTIPIAPAHRLDLEDLFADPNDPDDKPNLEILKQHLLLEGRLTDRAALRIIETGKTTRSLRTSQLKSSSSSFVRLRDEVNNRLTNVFIIDKKSTLS